MKCEAGFLFRMAAQQYPDRIALSWEGQGQTYRELNDTANRIGSGLGALGIGQGDRVGLLSYNRPEVIQTWIGCEKFGLVRVALHTHNPMEDQVATLNQVDATALIFDTRFTEELGARRGELSTAKTFIAVGPDCPDWATPMQSVVDRGTPADPYLDVDEEDACFLQLTSGTTGLSKPWIKTYRSWYAVINQNLIHLDTFDGSPAVGPDDVNLHFHPLQWATGFQTLYPYLIRGARTVVVNDEPFDADLVLDTMLSEGVTGTFAPGPLLSPLLDAIAARGGVDHALKRMVIFFGSPELLRQSSKWLGPVWAHGFGSTEQGAVTTRLLPSDVETKTERIDSVGRPASPNIEIAVFDPDGVRQPASAVGEIVVRSAMSQGAYWGMDERTDAAFFDGNWFRSGDVGYIDSDGFLFYGDRAGDTISVGDEVVYPHLVEAELLAHHAVANCGVVALDDGGSTVITAGVVLKVGSSPTDELTSQILGDVNGNLAAHQRLASVFYLDELPTVLGGAKVQRGILRDRLQARA